MQMKNVLDRLTELAKDNPSPDVKQAMENTRRMSVVEDAGVVEVHEGVAEGSRNAYLKHNNLVDLEKPLAGLENEFDKFLQTHDPEVKQKYQQGIKQRIKTGTMAGPKGVLPEQGVAEGSRDKVHLKTPKHGLADHPGRDTGISLRAFAQTPEQNRCPKCNSLFKNHYQQGVAEGFLGFGMPKIKLRGGAYPGDPVYLKIDVDQRTGAKIMATLQKIDPALAAQGKGTGRLDANGSAYYAIEFPTMELAQKAAQALRSKGVAEGSLEEVSLALAKRARDKAEDMADTDYDDMRDRPYGYSDEQRSKFQRYIDKKEPRAKGDRDWDPPEQGVAEGGKTSKQYWNRDSQSIGSTPDAGLTYADPDEDGVHYPDYANTKFQPQAKSRPATSANKRLTDKQYAKQLHKTYAPLYDTLRITFNRRKDIFSVTGDNGAETDYHKYRVDPATNKLKIMMSTSVENESINPGMAEGHFSDQDVQKKDKQYAGTKAYHAKNKAGKEKTAADAKTAFDAKFGGGNPASALKIREQSMTEGVNFAEIHRTKHATLDEMLNELHDDINTFKQCGQMSEQLRDFMEVHHYGKKQLMDAAYGPVDELADMTKLAGVQTPVTTAPAAVAPAAGPELAESSGEMINGKEVDMYSLEVGGVDYGDSPDFVDAYFEAGSFVDGTPLSDNELEQLTHERGDLVSELASEHMWAAGDDARDRQRDLDMEMEGVSDGDNGLASAHAKARRISGEHGVSQHVNCDPESGHHYCSDWYIDGETVGSYNMGKRYDDSGYIDEEEMMPGEESDVAQKAQGIEAVSGKKINQMNPGEIKMAGQKVDAMGVTESKQMVDECGMMGGSMQPNTPANINISASAASGGEVAAMINDLLKLAGRPENADTHMHEPGVVAIDGTMDASGAEELAAMLGGEEEVVDETGDAGGFADATTQPDALVYDENPVLTQTGVQKHTLGGYRNGDSPLAATTELEESLWRKFQNQ